MLKKEDVFSLLLKITPDFMPQWTDFQQEWKGVSDQPLYLCSADYVRFLISKLEKHEVANFPIIFSLIERFITEGDDYTQTLAVIGFLEDMQNTNFHHNDTKPEDFLPFQTEVTQKYWDGLTDFWNKVAEFKKLPEKAKE